MTDRWACSVCGYVGDEQHEHRRQFHDPSTRFGQNVPLLSTQDRGDLEAARERLEGMVRRGAYAEAQRSLEAVQRVLERDDHPLLEVEVSGPAPAQVRPHHHRPLCPTPGWGGRAEA